MRLTPSCFAWLSKASHFPSKAFCDASAAKVESPPRKVFNARPFSGIPGVSCSHRGGHDEFTGSRAVVGSHYLGPGSEHDARPGHVPEPPEVRPGLDRLLALGVDDELGGARYPGAWQPQVRGVEQR